MRKKLNELDALHGVLGEYRDVRRIYWYDHEPEDVAALTKCASDMRPFGWCFIPSGLTWWASGKLVGPQPGRGMAARVGIAFLRLTLSAEAFRMGWMVGSYKQATSCVERLAALQLERLNEQMAAARRGVSIRSSAEREEERMLNLLVDKSSEVTESIVQAGGPVAVAVTGDLGAFHPRDPSAQQGAAGAAAHEAQRGWRRPGGSSGGSSGPMGLVITDEHPAAHTGALHAASGGSSSAEGAQLGQQQQEAEVGAAQEQDVFAMLMGPGEPVQEAEPSEREQRRGKRRRHRWWMRGSSRNAPAEGAW
eukprot:scaffold13.g280.t1